jgi:hypothetical protein
LTSKLKLVAQKLAGQESGAKISTSEMMGVGNVKISSSPSGAKIYLDDKLSESTTPTTLRGLSSGQHNIRLEKGNLVGSKRVFVLPDMTSDVKVNLEPGYGSISITSKPSGGEISLDGSAIGTTPLKLDTIASGDHTVKIVCAGYTDYEETIHIGLNQFLNLNVVMKEFGGLLIESQPPKCKVYYEGEALGETPFLWEQRPAGESLLRLKYPGFRKLETRVTVKAAKLDTVRLILEPKYRSAGLVMSAFLPGSGQIYSGKPFKGLTFLALQIGSGYLAYNFAQEHKNKVGLYDEARMEYISAVYPGEIESARRLMDESYDETVKYQHLRDGFLAAAGAVYLYNIVDIMFINKFPANVPVPSGWQMSSYGESDEVGLKVSYGF